MSSIFTIIDTRAYIFDLTSLQITFFRKSVFFWANIPDKVHEVWGHITNKMRRFGNRGLAQLGEVRTFTIFERNV